MPAQAHLDGDINNYYGKPNKKMMEESDDLIDSKKLDYAAIWIPGKTIVKGNYVRIDQQGTTSSGGANLQIQVNGVSGRSSIAHVDVASNCNHRGGHEAQNVLDVVKQALRDSLGNARRVDVSWS